jgi:hypothetical protein
VPVRDLPYPLFASLSKATTLTLLVWDVNWRGDVPDSPAAAHNRLLVVVQCEQCHRRATCEEIAKPGYDPFTKYVSMRPVALAMATTFRHGEECNVPLLLACELKAKGRQR